jgi:RNA polymerase sigma-70 factor (ECF subfamily)
VRFSTLDRRQLMPSQDLEELKRLERAVGQLPLKAREIFLARRVDRLSYEEIASLTGLSERQLERHMARAISRLVRLMEDQPLRWWERWLRW